MKGAQAEKVAVVQRERSGHRERALRSNVAMFGLRCAAAPIESQSPDKSTEALIAAVACGDKPAFAALFERVAPRVKGYMMRLGSGEDQAEEIAQDVMVAVWRNARSYDPQKAAASTWIYRIARNRRIDLWRRDYRLELDPNEPGLQGQEPQMPLEILDTAQQARAVRKAVAALPEDLALVLRLAYFEGLTHSEIAGKLGRPLGTVKSRIRKAVGLVRKSLDLRSI